MQLKLPEVPEPTWLPEMDLLRTLIAAPEWGRCEQDGRYLHISVLRIG
ncbi:MAG: hypothetical protein ABIY55_08590 [Kofleriaceae bacterium]